MSEMEKRRSGRYIFIIGMLLNTIMGISGQGPGHARLLIAPADCPDVTSRLTDLMK